MTTPSQTKERLDATSAVPSGFKRHTVTPSTPVESGRGQHFIDAGSRQHLNAAAANLVRDRRRIVRSAQVDDSLHFDASAAQIERGCVAFGIRRQHDRALKRLHRIAMDQSLCRRGQHHAGQVVVAEYGRLLERAAGNDDAARTHLGHLARIDQGDPVVRVKSGSEGIGADPDVRPCPAVALRDPAATRGYRIAPPRA